jgi:hypothetical protein
MTSAKLVGGDARKYRPNMLPIDCAEKTTLAFALPRSGLASELRRLFNFD